VAVVDGAAQLLVLVVQAAAVLVLRMLVLA
jgi:hypothetical protein